MFLCVDFFVYITNPKIYFPLDFLIHLIFVDIVDTLFIHLFFANIESYSVIHLLAFCRCTSMISHVSIQI